MTTLTTMFKEANGDYSSVRVVGIAIGLATAFFLFSLGLACTIAVINGRHESLQWTMASAAAVVAAGSFGAANVLSKRTPAVDAVVQQ